MSDAQQFSEQLSVRVVGLLSEAQQVGILARGPAPETTKEALDLLSSLTQWRPAAVPEEDTRRIAQLEDEIAAIRKERSAANESLLATRLFAEKEAGFTGSSGKCVPTLDGNRL